MSSKLITTIDQFIIRHREESEGRRGDLGLKVAAHAVRKIASKSLPSAKCGTFHEPELTGECTNARLPLTLTLSPEGMSLPLPSGERVGAG